MRLRDVDRRTAPRMAVQEFIDSGLLQEVNRCFFAPVGLALEVFPTDEGGDAFAMFSLLDLRDSPEGVVMDGLDGGLVEAVRVEFERRADARLELLGYAVQPTDHGADLIGTLGGLG